MDHMDRRDHKMLWFSNYLNILSLSHLKPSLRYVGDSNGYQPIQKAVRTMTYVASPVMLLVFDSFHLVPQIPFVRNPSNSFYSILFFRFHPFSLGQKPTCSGLIKTLI
jgi:hypothetical protein